MYAVGVGKAVEDELREIASEPVEKHFYYTTDFNAISTIADNLKLNVCPGRSPAEPHSTRDKKTLTKSTGLIVGVESGQTAGRMKDGTKH